MVIFKDLLLMYANVQGFAAKIRVRCLGLVRLLMVSFVVFSFVLFWNIR